MLVLMLFGTLGPLFGPKWLFFTLINLFWAFWARGRKIRFLAIFWPPLEKSLTPRNFLKNWVLSKFRKNSKKFSFPKISFYHLRAIWGLLNINFFPGAPYSHAGAWGVSRPPYGPFYKGKNRKIRFRKIREKYKEIFFGANFYHPLKGSRWPV